MHGCIFIVCFQPRRATGKPFCGALGNAALGEHPSREVLDIVSLLCHAVCARGAIRWQHTTTPNSGPPPRTLGPDWRLMNDFFLSCRSASAPWSGVARGPVSPSKGDYARPSKQLYGGAIPCPEGHSRWVSTRMHRSTIRHTFDYVQCHCVYILLAFVCRCVLVSGAYFFAGILPKNHSEGLSCLFAVKV